MKILFVSNSYIEPGQVATGLPNYLKRVTRSLVSIGHDVTILYSTNYNQYRMENGIKVIAIRVPICNVFKKKFLIQGYCLNKKIEQIAETEKYDIIQFSSIGGIAQFYNGEIPSVMRLSSYAKTYFSSYATLSEDEVNIMSELEIEASRHVDGVFAPCGVTARAFGEDINRFVDVIESPFLNDVEEYDYSVVESFLKNKRYILFFGSLYIEKGIKVIGRIIEKFLLKHKDYFFLAVGEERLIDGENSSIYLKRSAGTCENRVIVCPQQPHSKLYPIIKESEFVILPSLMDNLPNACLEAMFFSKIVIGTNGASFEQLIQDGVNGFLCIINDSDSLYQTMEKVVKLKEQERRRIGEQANKTIIKLSPERIANRLIAYYSSIVDKRNKKSDGKHIYNNSITNEYRSDYCFNEEKLIKEADRIFLQRRLLFQWTKMKVNGTSLPKKIMALNISKVGIYGLGDIGCLLIDELSNSPIKILFGIDMRIINSLPISVITVDDDFPEVDAIIVTPIQDFIAISEILRTKYFGKILSIEDILFE